MRKAVGVLFFTLSMFTAIAHGADGDLTIINASSKTLYKIFISPSGESNWGRDMLGNYEMYPGGSYTFKVYSNICTVDIRAETQNGSFTERRKVNVCNGGVEWIISDK